MVNTVEIDLGGRIITLETGRLAKQAHGSVLVSCGDARVLSTATSNLEPKANVSFFPLTVDYREYFYAAGRIPGGYLKREGRMSDREILCARMIDRPIRPLFPEGYSCDTQIVGLVLSASPEVDPTTMAICGASASLAVSDIPFDHILGGIRIGMIDGEYVIEPSYAQQEQSKLNIVVAGTESGIVMVEAGATEATEEEVLAAIEFGHGCCKKIIAGIRELQSKAGKTKRTFTPVQRNADVLAKVEALVGGRLSAPRYQNAWQDRKLCPDRRAQAEAVAQSPRRLTRRKPKSLSNARERVFRAESSTSARGPTAAPSTRSVTSRSKPACCPARTAPGCSPAAKPRRWSPPPSAPRKTNSAPKQSTSRRPPSA